MPSSETLDEDRSFPLLGILGGGQLGKMMALAAIRMGIGVRFLSPKPDGPMSGLGENIVADWEDDDVLRAFAAGCTAVTVESEWAPGDLVERATRGDIPVFPRSETLHLIRHKGRQKSHLRDAGLPVPDFVLCSTLSEAREAAHDFGYPVVAKQYLRSYDGYGNATVRSDDELESAWSRLAADDGMMIESFVPFEQELSVLVARRPGGEHVIYPVAHTEQRDHRCHAVEVPARIDPEVASEARRVGLAAIEAVSAVGVTAVELFLSRDGRVLINELAPRPHNTGHYSIEACHTSQFENHVRAVLDLPLGSPDLRVPVAVMVNVLGHRDGKARPTGLRDALEVQDAAVHIYGKPEVKPRRKMGHVTIVGHDLADVRNRAEKAAALLRL